MKRKQIFLSDQQLQRLDRESERTGLSVGELVRRAVDKFLDEVDDKLSMQLAPQK